MSYGQSVQTGQEISGWSLVTAETLIPGCKASHENNSLKIPKPGLLSL